MRKAQRSASPQRRQLGFVSIGTALALLAASAGALLGDLGGKGLLDFLPGTGWIAADSSVQRINGMSGTIDGGIALTDDQGRPMEIIQDGDEVYFRLEDGTLARIEEATLGPGASVGLDPGTLVVENGGVAWFLEPSGDAAGHDAITLTPLGDPVDLGGKVADTGAAVDGTGTLFAVPGRSGEVAVADAAQGEVARHPVAPSGTALRLTRLDRAVVALDPKGRAVVEVRRDGLRPAIPLPGRGTLLSSPVVAGEDLWVLDDAAGLIKVDMRKGRAEAPIELAPRPAQPGPPLVANGYVYVPAGDTLITVDARTGRRQRDVQLPPAAKVSVRNGLLIADGDNTNLVIVKDQAVPVEDRQPEELPTPVPPVLIPTPPPPEPDPGPDPGAEGPDPGNSGTPDGADPGSTSGTGGGTPSGAPGGGNPPAGATATAPDPPRQPQAFPGDESAVVSWTPPASDGGSAITGYEISYTDSTGATVSRRTGADQRSLELPNLDNGDTYVFEIRAVSSAGSSAPATTGPITPTAEVPQPPTGASAAPSGRQAVQVSWTAPSGGVRLLDRYDVECASGGAPPQTARVAGTATSAQVSGLVGGAVYSCRVQAVNDAGVSSSPAVAPDVVAQDVPAAPVAVASPIAGGVRIDWSAPPANGSTITGYTVSLNGAGYASAGYQLNVGIARGGPYPCSIVAHSNIGDSPARGCDGNPSSPNQGPTAVTDPANGYMGGFVWGPSETGNVLKCANPAPNVLSNDTDPDDGPGGLSAHLTSGGGIGPITTVPGGYRAGSGQSYVILSTGGAVTEICVTRNAAVNLGSPLRLTYEARDPYGAASAADILFYLLCENSSGTRAACT